MTRGGLAEPRRDMAWRIAAMTKALVANSGLGEAGETLFAAGSLGSDLQRAPRVCRRRRSRPRKLVRDALQAALRLPARRVRCLRPDDEAPGSRSRARPCLRRRRWALGR